MRTLSRWFRSHAARQERMVLLEDALLSGRYTAYAFYRLRYFLGRTLVASALHIVEFLFLAFIFSSLELMAALFVRAATVFAGSYWWGGLEVMRERVRKLYADKQGHRVPDLIGIWIPTSITCALVAIGSALAWVLIDAGRAGQEFNLFHAYVFVNGVRLGCSLVTRTFHSGVYAVRRVYRPFWSIVAIDSLTFAGTLAAWPLLGPWSFPLLLLLGTALSSALTLVFTLRVYRFLRLVPSAKAIRRLGPVAQTLERRFVLPGLSYALIKLDAIVLLALYFGAQGGLTEVFLMFYLIAPFVRGSSDWAQLFYFDLKKLDLEILERFNRDFERVVSRLATVAGLVFWSLAVVAATLLLGKSLGQAYAGLALFFMLRSHLAHFQIRAYAQRQYFRLLGSGVLLVTGALLVVFGLDGNIGRKLIFLTALLVTTLLLLHRRSLRKSALERPPVLPPQEWILELSRRVEPLDLRSATLHRDADGSFVRELGKAIARRLGGDGRVTVLADRRIVWFEGHGTGRIDSGWLARRCGGLVETTRSLTGCEGGRDALERGRTSKFFDGALDKEWLADPPSFTLDALKKRFREILPGGVVYEPGRPSATLGAVLSRSERQEVMRAAIRYARSLALPAVRSRFEVTTLCTGGSIRLIFAARPEASENRRFRWRRFIGSLNLHAAIRPGIVAAGSGRLGMRYKRTVVWATILALVAVGLVLVHRQDRASGRFELRLVNRSELRAPAAGFVRECRYGEGDRVKAGEPICLMEIPDLESRIAQKRAEAKSLKTTLQNLRARGEDYRPADWARVAGLEEETRYLEQVRQRLVLTSSVDGVITTPKLRRSVGQYFREGDLICEVQEPSILEAEIVLPENRVERVRAGHRVELKALAFPYQTFHGEVTRVAPAAVASPEQATVTAYCRVDDAIRALRPGMTGYAHVLVGKRSLGGIVVDRVLRFVRTEFWW